MADSAKANAEPLKRKGGKSYPRISLEDVIEYSGKLVAKTHSGPLKGEMVYPGVLNTKLDSSTGQIRASALKQFGFLTGTMAGYSATPLAKQLAVAEGEERRRLLRMACLRPPVFAALFKTYNGDLVTLAMLRQRAGAENVHSQNVAECVSLFAESAVFAELANLEGEGLRLISERDVSATTPGFSPAEGDGHNAPAEDEEAVGDQQTVRQRPEAEREESHVAIEDSVRGGPLAAGHVASARSVIHVNFQIDATLDTEKLAKQLELLRRYGAI